MHICIRWSAQHNDITKWLQLISKHIKHTCVLCKWQRCEWALFVFRCSQIMFALCIKIVRVLSILMHILLNCFGFVASLAPLSFSFIPLRLNAESRCLHSFSWCDRSFDWTQFDHYFFMYSNCILMPILLLVSLFHVILSCVASFKTWEGQPGYAYQCGIVLVI